MPRRVLAAGLAAVLALPALAQAPVTPVPADRQPGGGLATPGAAETSQQRIDRTQQGGSPADTTTPRRQGQQASDNRGANPSPQQARQRSEAETRHITDTMAAGTVTFQAANFAATKAQNERVKRFAAFERDEQGLMTDILHSLADPAATSSTQAAEATAQNRPQNPAQAAATAPVLSGEASAALERMSRAEAGAGFDRDFVALQLERHRELLQIQERYLAGNPQNREQAAIAKLARGMIREHLAELETIQAELR